MLKTRTIQGLIRKHIEGRVLGGHATLRNYAHDASLFELQPDVVVYPISSDDICELVRFVNRHKEHNPKLSLTVRSGGTDMSGGAINDSIILDMTKHFTDIGTVQEDEITVEPGVYYRNFEPVTLRSGLLLPSYPASRELCTIGGMVANNSGGEKSLTYGKTERFVTELKVVLRDGREHSIRPLHGAALRKKLSEKTFEGQLYREVYELLRKNLATLIKSRPKVSKNSTGYNVWSAWDGKTLDLTKLIIGSQGTLGIVTEIRFKLVPAKPLSGMVVAFLPSLDKLADIINVVLPLQPTSMESFDEHTLKFAIRFFLTFRKTLGWKRFILLGLSFIPLLNKLLRYLPSLPQIILLIEFEGYTQEDIDEKIAEVGQRLAGYDIETHVAASKKHEEKFWILRRESFNLLRKNVKRKHTAPFIDDLIVLPKHLPQFLPRLTAILEKYQLLYTIAGHMGDGNFHVIPLMDLTQESERNKIPAVLDEVIKLVLEYEGSLSGEHNDGMIRGPFLHRMFDPKTMAIHRSVKEIFDPDNIFNPHKKTMAEWDFSSQHIRKRF